jgi:hypothetical protein
LFISTLETAACGELNCCGPRHANCSAIRNIGMMKFVNTLPKDRIYTPDYNSNKIPASVKILKPVIYLDTDKEGTYCCLLGNNPRTGIFGRGKTPEEAMENWNNNYLKIAAGSL